MVTIGVFLHIENNKRTCYSYHYKETEHDQITKQCIIDPERMLKYLLEEET